MNFLVRESRALAVGLVFAGWAVPHTEAGFGLEKISTTRGEVYREVRVVDADRHGLTFRHRAGIAKVGFDSLSRNIRMLYEPVGEVKAAGERDAAEARSGGAEPEGDSAGAAAAEGANEAKNADAVDEGEESAIRRVTFRTRTVIRLPRGAAHRFHRCPPCRRGAIAWRPHWPRYHPAHALVDPRCRAAVVRDFLYTPGLLPRPPGVTTRPLPLR